MPKAKRQSRKGFSSEILVSFQVRRSDNVLQFLSKIFEYDISNDRCDDGDDKISDRKDVLKGGEQAFSLPI